MSMPISADSTLISVVVCTHNRSHLLKKCLESLVSQHATVEKYEIVVVDNASLDDTDSVLQEYVRAHKYVRGFKEENLGLSHARNRGWREAVGEYVAFIDDDAIAFPDWILQINAFVKRHPEILAFGGTYEAYSLTPIPSWFPPEYGSWSLGNEERPVVPGEEWINGTNMVFHKEILSRFCGFDSQLGMAGDRISYGEETKLLVNLKNDNIPVYFVPKMEVKHLIADYKMKLSWLLLASYKAGRCSELTFGIRRSLCSHVSAIGACILAGTFNIMSGGFKPFKRALYVSFSPLMMELGAFVGFFSRRLS